MTFHEAQVALAKVYIGTDDVSGGGQDEVVNIEKPHDQTTSVDQIGKKDTVEKAVHLPKSIDEVGLCRVSSLSPDALIGKVCDQTVRKRSGQG